MRHTIQSPTRCGKTKRTRPAQRGRSWRDRATRLEFLEPRLMLAADPLGGEMVSNTSPGAEQNLVSDAAVVADTSPLVVPTAANDVMTNEASDPTPVTMPWQNPSVPMDVSGDSYVSPQDVLILLFELNHDIGCVLADPPVPPDVPPPYLDVSGDGMLSPLDLLFVLSYLNSGDGEALTALSDSNAGPEGEGDGMPSPQDAMLISVSPNGREGAALTALGDSSTEVQSDRDSQSELAEATDIAIGELYSSHGGVQLRNALDTSLSEPWRDDPLLDNWDDPFAMDLDDW